MPGHEKKSDKNTQKNKNQQENNKKETPKPEKYIMQTGRVEEPNDQK